MTAEAMPPTEGNIGPDGVRFRAFFGVLLFLFALGMTALLTVSGAPAVLRLAVFLPCWFSLLCLLQARAATCVFLAARGACSTEAGVRPIQDEGRRQALLRRAGRIHLQAMLGAAVLTLFLVALSLLVPFRFPGLGQPS